jgi:hypothetical protein
MSLFSPSIHMPGKKAAAGFVRVFEVMSMTAVSEVEEGRYDSTYLRVMEKWQEDTHTLPFDI